MNWLTNFVKPKLLAIKSKLGKKENLWTKCTSCQQIIFTKELKDETFKITLESFKIIFFN